MRPWMQNRLASRQELLPEVEMIKSQYKDTLESDNNYGARFWAHSNEHKCHSTNPHGIA